MNEILTFLRLYPGIRNKIFVTLKWIIFPFNKMEKYLPKAGDIVDIGCGEGVFALYTSLQSKKRRVFGIDLNKNKISLAKKAGRRLKNLTFEIEEAMSWNKKVDGIVISDTFHHFSRRNQELFLQKVSSILRPLGVFLIKEINKDDFIRAKLSRLWDLLLYPEDSINYWSREEFKRKLKELGFKVSVKREAVFFPGSTVLYICSKK